MGGIKVPIYRPVGSIRKDNVCNRPVNNSAWHIINSEINPAIICFTYHMLHHYSCPPLLKMICHLVISSLRYNDPFSSCGSNSVVPKWAYIHLNSWILSNTTKKIWRNGRNRQMKYSPSPGSFNLLTKELRKAILWLQKKRPKSNSIIQIPRIMETLSWRREGPQHHASSPKLSEQSYLPLGHRRIRFTKEWVPDLFKIDWTRSSAV